MRIHKPMCNCVCAHVCTHVYVCGMCHKSVCMQVPMGVDVCTRVCLPANARGKCCTLPSDAICIFETGLSLGCGTHQSS